MKKYAFILHVLCWMAIPFCFGFIAWAYQYTCYVPGGPVYPIKPYTDIIKETAILSSIIVLVGATSFYLTQLAILPWMPAKKGWYALAALLAFPGVLTLVYSQLAFAVYWSFYYFLFTAYLVIIPSFILGTLFWAVRRSIRTSREMAQLENRNMQTALELLKSKTNPHFLFNTINNIDALIRKDPEKASHYLNELSGLLRFMLYESGGEKIPLEAEIGYIEKYIQLQRIRSVNPEFVSFRKNGSLQARQIAPMIFIPIIENAFKHVHGKTEKHAIMLDLNIGQEDVLFTCKNLYRDGREPRREAGGLGMHLITQRLDILYKNRYEMLVDKADPYYQVTLKIQLDAD